MVHLLLAIIYLSFISLGLPDAVLGAAWPSIYPAMQVPVSYAGMVSVIISFGTIVSSLQSDRMVRKFGTGVVTAVSVAMTAAALLGFSLSSRFWMLCLWAVPYGLGAGSVDAGLNNYVALHFESRHMSWLHCMWGLGATIGPSIMGFALTKGLGWHTGYRIISGIQFVLALGIAASLPLWVGKKRNGSQTEEDRGRPMKLTEILRIPGAKEAMLFLFSYCAVEQTAGFWASSYLTLAKGVEPETAAGFAALFYIGITLGRGLCGFVTMKLSDPQMIRLGGGILAVGIVVLLIPGGESLSLAGMMLVGLGCAPIFPCMIHSVPARFGEERSQAIIGVQMASAYLGILLMPPLFGILANVVSIGILPGYLALFLAVMGITYRKLNAEKTGS